MPGDGGKYGWKDGKRKKTYETVVECHLDVVIGVVDPRGMM